MKISKNEKKSSETKKEISIDQKSHFFLCDGLTGGFFGGGGGTKPFFTGFLGGFWGTKPSSRLFFLSDILYSFMATDSRY